MTTRKAYLTGVALGIVCGAAPLPATGQDLAGVQHARWCRDNSPDYNGRVLSGTVRFGGDGSAAAGAQVLLTWPQPSGEGILTAESDSAGLYRVCGIPPVERVVLRAVLGDQVSEFLQVDLATTGNPSAMRNWHRDIQLGPAPSRRIAVSGTVTDGGTDRPIPGATVELWGTDASTITNPAGGFRLDGVWAGEHRIMVRSIGYRAAFFDVALPSGRDAAIPAGQLAIRPAPPELDPVIVEVEPGRGHLEGFYRRRQTGLGSFVTREEFEVFNPQVTTDVLRRLSILNVRPNPRYGRGGDVRRFLVESRRAIPRLGGVHAGECPAVFFIDGVYMGDTRDNEIDLAIDPTEIEAVEAFDGGQVPSRFNAPGSQCGVVSVWTRRGAR